MNINSKILEESKMIKTQNIHKKTFRRFLHDPLGVMGLFIICLLILISLLSPFIAPYDPTEIDTDNVLQEPSGEHLFGTDELGRDIFSRVIHGSRVTLLVMIVSISIAIIIGTILGIISGYIGGIVDTIMMRVVDSMLAFPTIILALSIIAILGPSIRNAIIAIAIINIFKFTRLVRGRVLSVKEREYISSAKSIGCSRNYIMFKEILPNSIDIIIIYGTLLSAEAILIESALSFLGLSVQPPTPSWGWIIVVGMRYYSTAWWMVFFPGLAIFITVLSINFLGDTLRDVFDVELRI